MKANRKRDLYDGGIRVPLIARWPGRVAPGSVSPHVGYFGDFFATFAELLGRPSPAGLDSISLLPTLLGRPREQRTHDYLYWEFYEQGGRVGLRAGDWKAVRMDIFKNPDAPLELYNLADDIGEANNVAAAHPDIAQRLGALLEQAHTPSPDYVLRTP